MNRPPAPDDREARLAQALRANLRRRKAAGREEERGEASPEPQGKSAPQAKD